MAIQEWTIIKLVGPAANDAADRFERWWSARRSDDPSTPNDWHATTRRAVTRYLARVEAHRLEMPVAYFSQHTDLWLHGGQLQSHLGGSRQEVIHDWGDLCIYRLPDRGKLVKRNLPIARSSTFPETKWLATRLIEAAQAYDKIWRDATLLINRRAITASPADDELLASAAAVPKWLGR